MTAHKYFSCVNAVDDAHDCGRLPLIWFVETSLRPTRWRGDRNQSQIEAVYEGTTK